jgi:hypothetical protein
MFTVEPGSPLPSLEDLARDHQWPDSVLNQLVPIADSYLDWWIFFVEERLFRPALYAARSRRGLAMILIARSPRDLNRQLAEKDGRWPQTVEELAEIFGWPMWMIEKALDAQQCNPGWDVRPILADPPSNPPTWLAHRRGSPSS